jgi:hypothetical protein
MNGLGGMWLPGTGDTPEETVRNSFERSYMIFAMDGHHPEQLIGNLAAYGESVLKHNLNGPKGVDIESVTVEEWCAWLDALEEEHHERQRAAKGMPAWVWEHMRVIDADLRRAVAKKGLTPEEAVAVYREWASAKKEGVAQDDQNLA